MGQLLSLEKPAAGGVGEGGMLLPEEAGLANAPGPEGVGESFIGVSNDPHREGMTAERGPGASRSVNMIPAGARVRVLAQVHFPDGSFRRVPLPSSYHSTLLRQGSRSCSRPLQVPP